MYCPKCKKDIKPGTEKKKMHQTGLMALGFGVCWMILGPILLGLDELFALVYGMLCVIGGLVFGLNKRQAVCPACEKVLLPENPFSDP